MVRSIQFYFNLILVGLSLVLIQQSLKIQYKDEFLSSGRILPLLLSIVMLLLSIIILVKEIKVNRNNEVLPDNFVHFFGFIFLTIFYVVMIPVINFAIATFGFLLLCFLFLKSTKWWKGILISVVFVASVMIIFEYLFHIIFP